MSASDELVSQFIAFTGCVDPERAQSYLEMSGGNVETAVGLYMEHQPGSAGGGGGDAAAAAAGGGGDMMDDIRAPDATQTMRLMDEGHGHGGGGGAAGGMFHQMMMDQDLHDRLASSAFSNPSSLFGTTNVRDAVNAAAAAAAAAGSSSDDDDDTSANEITNNANNATIPTAARLADMFAAPNHLIYDEGGFEGARNMARDNKRWLLVNLQRDSEFSCHALNRDVWRNDLVENLIREGFIFWQAMDIAPEGQVYAQRYHVHDFPHIAIIDPRTRRLLWKKEGWTQQNPMTADTFAEIAMDFCSRHSFDKPPAAPRPGGGGRATSSSSSAAASKKPAAMENMSEEEQLQAAMRASLGGGDKEDDNAYGGDDDDDDMEDDYEYNDFGGGDDDDDEDADVGGDSSEMVQEDEAEDAKPTSLIDELLKADNPDEPASGARIQLRLPDGKRVVRKFNAADAVRAIYVYFVHSNEEAKGGKEFTLMAGYPPKDLIDDIDSTIEACKLSGQAITVRWK